MKGRLQRVGWGSEPPAPGQALTESPQSSPRADAACRHCKLLTRFPRLVRHHTHTRISKEASQRLGNPDRAGQSRSGLQKGFLPMWFSYFLVLRHKHTLRMAFMEGLESSELLNHKLLRNVCSKRHRPESHILGWALC